MSDQERYVQYIEAHRAGNKEMIDKMLAEGFRPDRQQLMEYARNDRMVREALFNKRIKVRLDVGSMVGHVYGYFPYYDETQNKIVEGTYGYYPKTGVFPKVLLDSGVVRDEVHETRRVEEDFPTHEITLPLTEESWIHLAHWVTKKRKDTDYYMLVGKNCAHFVDMALKEAGYEDGLLDKFDPSKVHDLNFRLIKLEIADYFRYDKRGFYESHIKIPIIETEVALQLSKQAKADRNKSNWKSHGNHVNAFFDKYHDEVFYQAYFKNKPLTMEDMTWLIRNRAPGLENRIHSTLIHIFAEAPEEIQQQFSYSPAFFIGHVVRTLGTDPKSLDLNIQKLFSTVKVNYDEDEIAVRYRQPDRIQFFRVSKNASTQEAQYVRVMAGFGEEISSLVYTSALNSLRQSQENRDLKENLEREDVFKQDCLKILDRVDRQIQAPKQVSKAKSVEPRLEESQPVVRKQEQPLMPSLTVPSLSTSRLGGSVSQFIPNRLSVLEKQVEVFKQGASKQIMKNSYTPQCGNHFAKQDMRQKPALYNCPPPYAKLPLFKAMSWKKEPETSGMMHMVIVYNPNKKTAILETGK